MNELIINNKLTTKRYNIYPQTLTSQPHARRTPIVKILMAAAFNEDANEEIYVIKEPNN